MRRPYPRSRAWLVTGGDQESEARHANPRTVSRTRPTGAGSRTLGARPTAGLDLTGADHSITAPAAAQAVADRGGVPRGRPGRRFGRRGRDAGAGAVLDLEYDGGADGLVLAARRRLAGRRPGGRQGR